MISSCYEVRNDIVGHDHTILALIGTETESIVMVVTGRASGIKSREVSLFIC